MDLWERVSIRYIAVLGFQPQRYPRYCKFPGFVSIRYIAVLGFQHAKLEIYLSHLSVSIRYIAVLGFQRKRTQIPLEWEKQVSIRYIAVLGFQRGTGSKLRAHVTSFHPLYRGTWFPTRIPLGKAGRLVVSIRYIAVLGFQHR